MIKHNHTISNWLLMVILATLMAVTSLSVDIYLPAMPQMQHDLSGDIELTITGFLVGFALAQLVWGPISDRIGRRKPLFIGMILFIIGSVGCALSQDIEQIIFWRIFQAFGACTGPMIARAIVRDLYSKTKAAQVLSTLTIVMAIAPIAGPLIGGQLIQLSSWHSIFWLLAAIGTVILLSILFLPETHLPPQRVVSSIKSTFSTYYALLGNWQFMRYTLCVTFFYVAAYAFIVGSPFVYIDYYGISAQYYGWLFSINIIGLVMVSFINRRLVMRYSLDLLLRCATIIALVALLILAILFYWQIGEVYSIIILVFIFFSMNGIIAACSTAAALNSVAKIAGSASALIGSLQYGSGIISSALLAWLSTDSPATMIVIMTLFSFVCAFVIFLPHKGANHPH
ncbi:DHA1 family bicyclomycin/chloramphenicol resistance-like MFS transporter [Orbus hercynius]|uniref:Bcr/CflA family efflux transporter n=1 Tax=Orbus hercynius TaxID=593135 RepID=A0A495RJE4_9GAMM|nr:multidrug effflux MFS transporter [Orbus hercynius]RKS87565.1 DHA1 family bicyclomycin/chloramphenicol resistance-like MFS transporter [Orbus hercynius]